MVIIITYPTAILKWSRNSNDKLWKLWVVKACHPTKCQQLVNNRKQSIKKFCFDAITKVVNESGVFHLDSTKKCFNDESMT